MSDKKTVTRCWYVCPGADCQHEEPVSINDPDASFSEILDHIHNKHPEIDRDPSLLWPSVEVTEHE